MALAPSSQTCLMPPFATLCSVPRCTLRRSHTYVGARITIVRSAAPLMRTGHATLISARTSLGAQPCYQTPRVVCDTRALSPLITIQPPRSYQMGQHFDWEPQALLSDMVTLVATDGGCRSTPGVPRAGWGLVFLNGDKDCGAVPGPYQTAQRGEATAVFRLCSAPSADSISLPTVGMSLTHSTAPSKGDR